MPLAALSSYGSTIVIQSIQGVEDASNSAGGARDGRLLRPGGIAVGIAGPPDPGFAREIGANRVVRLATVLLSGRTRLRARRRHVRYSFLFMKASGEQLRAIAALVDAGAIRPVIDRVFPFESTKDAMAYAEGGRAKGKVIITMADLPPARPVMPPAAQMPATLTQIPSTEGHGHD